MAMTNNKKVLQFIDESAALCQPDKIVWIDGSKEQIENAKKYLELAGAKKTFVTSSYTGEGFDAFLKYMEEMDSHA